MRLSATETRRHVVRHLHVLHNMNVSLVALGGGSEESIGRLAVQGLEGSHDSGFINRSHGLTQSNLLFSSSFIDLRLVTPPIRSIVTTLSGSSSSFI